MSPSDQELLSQLRWWLTLPPTNLIDRGDQIRFRHALYLIVHQASAAILARHGSPQTLTFPSTLQDISVNLDGHIPGPGVWGQRLLEMIGHEDDRMAWNTAADLIEGVLDLADSSVHEFSEPVEHIPKYPAQLHTLAEVVAERYRKLDGINAIALSGSLGRGLADSASDVDLSVFCSEIPGRKNRSRVIKHFEQPRAVEVEPSCDTFWIDGSLIHIRFWNSDEVAQLVMEPDTPPENPFLAEDLQCCTPIIDANSHLAEQKLAVRHFSPALIEATFGATRARLSKFKMLWNDAQRRDDLLHLYCLANQAANDWLIALFSLNHRYLSTPKWISRQLKEFTLVPERCVSRLREIMGPLTSKDDRRWKTLESLWGDLLSLRK